MRKYLSWIICVAAMTPLMLLAVSWVVSEVRWSKVNDPRGKFTNAKEYLAAGRLPERVCRAERDGKKYLIAFSPMDHGAAQPSGPAAYVFDERGEMVEWSRDTGDDTHFMRTWPVGKEYEVPLDELRRLAEGEGKPEGGR